MKTSDTYASVQPEQQTSTYQYYADNQLKSVTDALGRTTAYDYDALGNKTLITRLAGTLDAVSYTATYDQAYGNLLTTTDPLGHSYSFTYNIDGELVKTQDALGHGITLTYDDVGEPSSMTDAVGNTTNFTYNGGVLTTITDPLGKQTVLFPDDLGRVIQKTDPLGNTTRYQYNNKNKLTLLTNAQGNQITYAYDLNGNLLSVHDFLSHATQYTYDTMDRRITSTDPLQKSASVTYDLGGNPVSVTDRKGQVTVNTFDALGRLTFKGFGASGSGSATTYESTLSYQYDSGSRMISATDSAAGAISRSYDGLNRLTSETTPQGDISYTYDTAGRRSSAQLLGGALTSYGYDDANRLMSITQGSAQVGFSYDNANRRNTLTLPNGVLVQYAYDQDSHVQSISYGPPGNPIGTLAYVYDAAGNRVEVDGTLAKTALPAALTSATYDAANELLSADGASYSYDANGNMISGLGGSQLTWNARNQLSAITGFINSSFSYDALGRRVSKTISGQSTNYQYDGVNRIAEVSAAGTASILPGSIDEFFLRTDSAGTISPLVDATGSTVGLTDPSGNLITSYTYEPYGATELSGTSSNNLTQYTGRENDGNGLYYYRARYYDTQVGRFVSRDPLGFGGGDINLYRYAGNNPISYIDPSGLDKRAGGSGGGPGGEGASNGNGTGGSDNASNDEQQQTPQQNCLSDFNNNLLGKTVNFLSLTSPFIGPEPGQSAIEMIVGGHIKVGAISTLKGLGYASEGLESTPWLAIGEAVGVTAEGIAEEVGSPAVAVATLSQVGVHLGCKYLAQ